MKRRRPLLRVLLKPDAVWRLLDLLHISQNELARRVGISSGYMSDRMCGERLRSPHMRRRLQDILGVTDFHDLSSSVPLTTRKTRRQGPEMQKGRHTWIHGPLKRKRGDL